MAPDELEFDDDSDTIANGVIVAWSLLVGSSTVLALASKVDGYAAMVGTVGVFLVMVAADVYIRHINSDDTPQSPALPDGGDDD